ncbi:MAG TPA: tRNA preQ1(34) S-adenosylmethionine ribosyltransferase-isomerase QueA [Gammaproteobacteria bacterium]|jgi:S-adenosylmethionine:tRNA ribosyltransferase-isomerase|nr:tRNA preQ1(34) S-adenosylmethionine ribosyltransferase-isomerase QueA [Gammaproteobacteria bacterium]
MQLTDFHFDLPDELIAKYPAAVRSESRLLSVGTGMNLTHMRFHQLIQLVNDGDLLVFNDTRVIPARVFGQKITGGLVEILVERVLDHQRILAQVRVSKPPRIGDFLQFPNHIQFEVVGRVRNFYELKYTGEQSILDVIESIGQIPLPPYMRREADESDKERYQTVYARHKGSVAAPTAGFHFDETLLDELEAKGVEMGFLTLHIGAGTFAPVRVENIHEHQMHPEYLVVPEDLCEKIRAVKLRGKRVIAVGTTSLRALETASQSGEIMPYEGETSIFIYPGYQFRCADALITNMHLPCSTLLMLVCAFSGYDRVMHAYREAVKEGYKFYSYGDAMWMEMNGKGFTTA